MDEDRQVLTARGAEEEARADQPSPPVINLGSFNVKRHGKAMENPMKTPWNPQNGNFLGNTHDDPLEYGESQNRLCAQFHDFDGSVSWRLQGLLILF